jgi:hypothetical protein
VAVALWKPRRSSGCGLFRQAAGLRKAR